ncbi:hypothetical protein IWX78_001045 [Mycetocola sp. CAN_C7]|uniref:PH-like domain-containing protein n=1 Tax=Mycetocola sp. CAN_C7 TaxID=2787724 RepID=UPI0018C9C7EC
MPDRILPAAIVLAFLALLLLGMWLAWRARSRRDAGVPAGTPLPADGIHPIESTAVLYVATTKTGQPLERLAIRGLAFRASADLTVANEGVVLSVPGQEPVFIAAGQIRSAQPATWTIDRVVETDGLLSVSWLAGHTDVDSYVRVIDPTRHSRVLTALTSLVPTASASSTSQTDPTDSTESEK